MTTWHYQKKRQERGGDGCTTKIIASILGAMAAAAAAAAMPVNKSNSDSQPKGCYSYVQSVDCQAIDDRVYPTIVYILVQYLIDSLDAIFRTKAAFQRSIT